MNTGKQINIMVALIFVTLIVYGAYTIWDPTRADEAAELQVEKTADRGAHIFAQNCRLCHGDSGEGGALGGRLPQALPLDRPDLQGRPGADEPIDPLALRRAEALVRDSIVCGRVGTFMPIWGDSQGGPLNDEQIRQLTVLITTGRWDLAAEYAHEIDVTGIHLTADIAAADTEIPLESTAGFLAGNPIKIAEERMTIAEVRDPLVVVRRAALSTEAVEHAAGDTIVDTNIALTRAVAPTDTELHVDGATGLEAGKTIRIGDEHMIIQSVRQPSLVVERGVLGTEAAPHAAGVEVLNQPPVPQNPTLVTSACGQRLLAPVPTAAEATPTAGPGTVVPTTGPTATPTPLPSGVQEVTITAEVGIKFDLDQIRVKPGTVVIHFVNDDIGVPHNIAFYTDNSASDAIAGANEGICTGPCSYDLTIEVPDPGEYFFRCDVHPTVMVGDLIVEE